MALYTVWISFEGYDVNCLVQAKTPKQAREFAAKYVLTEPVATLMTDELAKDLSISGRLLEKMRKAKNGAVYIYDEGT